MFEILEHLLLSKFRTRISLQVAGAVCPGLRYMISPFTRSTVGKLITSLSRIVHCSVIDGDWGASRGVKQEPFHVL